jgi:fluoride ion exporter CrcB/FEX
MRQVESGNLALGLVNIGANVLLSLAAVWAGMAIMQAVD